MSGTLRRTSRVSRVEAPPETVAVGEWYWLRVAKGYTGADRVDPDGTRHELVCVTHVGSNYVQVENVNKSEWRVHFAKFDVLLRRAPEAQRFIGNKVEHHRQEAVRLMNEVRLLTARLAIRAGSAREETQALTLRHGEPVTDYKKALVTAKDKTLPKLFEDIKKANDSMAMWMKAQLVPLRAQVSQMQPVFEAIESRIFNVELYAGLCEQVVQVRDGAPAGATEPVRLMQRRAYMDEECLLDYRTGGIEFHDVPDFDAWMAKPESMARLLPFPRCVLAMQVRRTEKEREAASLSDYIAFAERAKWDESTFLYMRNGDQLFRLRAGVAFGPRLFPDVEASEMLGGHVLYAKYFTSVSRDADLITEAHYQELRTEYIAHRLSGFSGEDKPASKKLMADRRKDIERSERAFEPIRLTFDAWVQWDQRSAYFDDVTAVVNAQVEHHNRVVMVLQGLLDRSPVFHPHPAWRLWEPESFAQALVRIYDESRGLVSTEHPPDFEAYRRRLNATLGSGSVTIGQEDAWERLEAERENARQAGDYRVKYKSQYVHYRPYLNPGPGLFAKPARVTPTRCLYTWTRGRQRHQRWGNDEPVGCRIVVPMSAVLHADAYTPGDFRQFFQDPRTRAEYLKWAPLLLECEEFKAGNRKVGMTRKE